MPSSELVLEYAKTLVWPLVALYVLIRHHSQLSDLIQRITRVRLPGGGELDAEVKNVITRIGEQAPSSSSPYTPQEIGASILARVESDPTLALAELRMQLEESLKAIYKIGADIPDRRGSMSLAVLSRELHHRGDLPAKLIESLRDVIVIADRAVHGEQVSQAAANNLANVGVKLLKELKMIYGEKVSKPEDTFIISDADRDRLMERTRYKVTTVVPLAEKPIVNVRILDQEGLDELLEGYGEYAEFLVAIEPLNTSLPLKDNPQK
jgi:hypothetical protein